MSIKDEGQKRTNLGMGLSALFGENKSISMENLQTKVQNVPNANGIVVENLPLSQIERNLNQPRKEFKQEELEELSKSIKENGILQPILVRASGTNRYQIVAGERRFRASKMAGLETIPAIVTQEKSDEKILHLALLENIQRSNLSIIEEGYAYKNLIENFKCTHETIAKTLGKSRAHITNALRILKLPNEVLEKVSDETLTFGHAKVLAGTDNPLLWYQVAIEKNLTVRGLEDLIHSSSSHPKYSDEVPSGKKHGKPSVGKKVGVPVSKEEDLDELVQCVSDVNDVVVNIEQDEDNDNSFYLIIKCNDKKDLTSLLNKLK